MEHQLSAMLTPAKHEGLYAVHTERRNRTLEQQLVAATLALSDVLLAFLIWGVAYVLQSIWGRGPLTEIAAAAVIPTVAVWVGLRALLGLYPGYGLDQVEVLRRHAYSVFATVAITAVFAVAFQYGYLLSRLMLILGFLGVLLLAPLTQYLVKQGMRSIGLWGKPVVIVGSRDTGTRLTKLLRQEWELGYNPVAVFDYWLAALESVDALDGEETSLAEAAATARRGGVNTIIFALPHTRREQLARLVGWASASFRHVVVIPNLGGITNSAVTARDLAGTLGVEIKYNLLDPWARTAKRALDLCGAVVGGLLITPLLLAMAIAIKLDSPGPVFYGHRRLGSGHKHFRCWKFRTMHRDAEKLLDECLQGNPLLQAEWEQTHKLRDDPRVTRVGRLLRKTSLDELPQLWNVLRGEMSLIGPRPIVDAEVPKYEKAYELYTRIRPGMSGFWQVSGRSDTGYEERVAMDSYYVRNWSVWLDLVLLARTVKSVVLGRGAY